MEQNKKQGEEITPVKSTIKMAEKRDYTFVSLFLSEFHEGEEKEEHVKRYLDGLHYTEQIREMLWKHYSDIAGSVGNLDAIISQASVGWDLKRIGKAELNILRIAVYEIVYDADVPNRVAANEAVELAKKYGGEQSFAFVNGILSKVIKDHNGAEL